MTIVDSNPFSSRNARRCRTHQIDRVSDHGFSNYDSGFRPEYASKFRNISFAGKRNRQDRAGMRKGRTVLASDARCTLQFPQTFR
jgi:hypothetical protein